jgi:hypothetical protein
MGNILPLKDHLSLIRFDTTCNQIEKCRFAGTIKPDEAPKLSVLESKIYSVDGLKTAKSLTEIL